MSSGRRSPPQEAGNNSVGNAEPFYTNEDVAVLHDIVILAQELLPTLPERERLPTNALFSAYYDILPRIGVNADHDSRYARILFKIGGLRGQSTLYERFEEILSRMGIEIEFDEGEQDLEGQSQKQTDIEISGINAIPQDENIPARGRRRRNSESSAWDVGYDMHPKLRDRRNSHSSIHILKPAQVGDGQDTLQEPPSQRQPPDQAAGIPKDAVTQQGHDVGTWLNENPRMRRGRSVSIQAAMRIRRRSPSLITRRPAAATSQSPKSDEYQAQSEITAVTSAHGQDASDYNGFLQEYPFSKPSSSLMLIKAEVILQHHLSFLAKCQLRVWREKALQLREDNINLILIALHHDKNALLNQALETWHNRLLAKRSIAETERFFAHLERRSIRARDLYLLHKAFTHWNVRAYEEAERTSVARRHILRARTFNAWRDITAVNELKVRRQVLKKFFAVWKRQHTVSYGNHTTAVQTFESNLVEKIFNKWVRKVWDMKATIWWTEGVKQRTFFRWAILARSTLQAHRTSEEERHLQLAWNSWQTWRAKMDEHIRQDLQAATFHQAYVCLGVLRKWRRETRVLPAKNILQTDVATRLCRESFAIWLHRTRQEKQATALDRMRIVREAWTHWRHKQRFQVMRAHVDDRVVLQSIYKWVLAERKSLGKRLFNQSILRSCIQNWVRKAQDSKYQRWDQEDLAQRCAVQKTQRLLLRRWSSRTRSQHQLVADAVDIYVPRLLRGVLVQWLDRAKHLQQLQQWSRDAQFYFLTSKTLKQWKASTEMAKREKRKVAYGQVRRITKLNLARGILLGWRHKAQQIITIKAQAQEMSQNRDIIIGMNIFDRWRARAEELEDLDSLWREKALRKCLVTWRDRSSAFQDLKVESIINFQERQQTRAVKKWNLVVLQLRAQSLYASEIREKNAKRTFRKIFSYWHQRTAQTRPFKRVKISDGGEVGQVGAAARAEVWSDFGDENEVDEWAKGVDEPISFTPLPGYLSTPSKRTERVAAVAARFSSTTPRAPLSTQSERHLRAQYSGGLLPSLRKGLGRSALGMGGGFPDITDRGMKEDWGKK